MRRALSLAERGWGRVAPNPLVGAVVVKDGEVVGEGWHREYGLAHAEVEALRDAGDRSRGASLYVTLEPCSHHGKTPPCTDAVRDAGIRRLVYAAADPNPTAAGGSGRLAEAGIEVVGGVEAQAALDLNAPFFHLHTGRAERPWVALKLALSLDGKIADAAGDSAWVTGEAARAEVHRLRAGFDAVAVGSGTALADDPLLTVRGAVEPRRRPVRIVFDRALRLQPGSRLVAGVGAAPVWVVTSPGASRYARERLEGAGVRILEAESLAAGLRELRSAGIGSLLCEGGGVLASALLRAESVDRMVLFLAPLLLGPKAAGGFPEIESPRIAHARRWRQLRAERLAGDTMITLARE